MNFKEFSRDPYLYVDKLNLIFRGKNLNIFQKYETINKTFFQLALISLALWILFGFDSSPNQFAHVLYEGLPGFLQGSLGLQDLHAIYDFYYGKEMHYSAFVIYLLLYWALSKSWKKAGVIRSKNIVFSFGGMILAIGVFEWFWILSFGTFQNQPWITRWLFPQLRILLQNTFLVCAGLMVALFMLIERYHWNGREQLGRAYYFNAKSWALFICLILSIGSALLWIYYPGPGEEISVVLETGEIWHNSSLFPQTLYTIDLNPLDSVNAGEWFYVNNDMIHALNTIVKVFWALSIYLLFRVKDNP